MSELNFSLEQASHGSDRPGDNGLCDLASLDGLNDTVFLDTTYLTQKEEDFDIRVILESEHMVNEGCSWITITSNGDALADTVGHVGDDVVQLVGHTTGFGDVANGAGSVQFGGDNVVHHTTGVANLVGAWFDATNGSRSNDGHTLLLGNVEDFASALATSVQEK
jgi:hypothetical protein